VVRGRRRVGKTALVAHFASSRRAVSHTGASRPTGDELRALSRSAAEVVVDRDLGLNPFHDWTDALESLVRSARDRPLLVVLDEFPELVAVSPELPSLVRAV